jgi:glycosyltransferase involved in cell wall biosynthesis
MRKPFFRLVSLNFSPNMPDFDCKICLTIRKNDNSPRSKPSTATSPLSTFKVRVLFFSLFRTDNPYSSISLSMAKELAKDVPVLYVNHPYSLKDIWRGLWQGDRALLRRMGHLLLLRSGSEHLEGMPERFLAVTPAPTLPINWLPPGRLYDLLHGFNNRIVLRCIRRWANKRGFGEYVYINCYNPFYATTLPKEWGAKTCIYHCIDDISQNPYTARHGLRLENQACQEADITFVTSTNLRRLKEPYARRLVTYFNAADVSVFSRALNERFERPAELSGRRGKVIGFIGNLDELRIDYSLLQQVALRFPEHTLLLVGPRNSPEIEKTGLDRLPNVVLTGSRPLQALPPLLQHMDCALIPFLCNTLTYSIYPLKINEYLAAGKAVVSTAFSEDIRTFAHCIYLAENHEQFLENIAKALNEENPPTAMRTATAAANTWEARIRELRDICGN